MKYLFILAFASAAISILSRRFSLNLPGRFVFEFLSVAALSVFLGVIGYRCVWTWSLARVIPAYQSRNWPTVEGKIIHSSIREETTGKGRPPTHIYYPEIRYVYEVNGQRFEGHNLMYEQEGPPVFEREIVETNLKSLAMGETVKVFYDSRGPYRSCLRPGFYENPVAHVLMNLLGVFMLASGLVALWRVVRRPNEQLRQTTESRP